MRGPVAALLEVAQSKFTREVRLLVDDFDGCTLLTLRIVEVREHVERERFVLAAAELPAVKPDDVRAVVVDNLFDLVAPFGEELLVRFCLRVSVEIGILRIEDVPAFLAAPLLQLLAPREEPAIAAEMVEASQDFEVLVLLAEGGRQLAVDVALRPHLRRVPAVELRVPQAEAIVMDNRDADVLCARTAEDPRPLGGIELLRLELRYEVLVPDLRLSAVGCDVVFEDVVAASLRVVHQPPIPLRAIGGDAVDAPVRIEAQLGVDQPRGRFVLVE